MNGGFNAATDLFSMGAAWKVKSANLNASHSVAEAPNNDGDMTHRDVYADRIAPTAEYELAANVTSLPALGTVVTIDGKKVAIASIAISTSRGEAPTATVTGVQVEDTATTGRTYSCGTIDLKPRHKAQDITGFLASASIATLIGADFTFAADVTVGEPQGIIESSDVGNGRVEASYNHVSGDGTTVATPSVSGTSKVVSAPVSKTSPENDYTTFAYSVTDTLTGSEAA